MFFVLENKYAQTFSEDTDVATTFVMIPGGTIVRIRRGREAGFLF